MSNSHKPGCAVLAGDWSNGCTCADQWRLEARLVGYPETAWPAIGPEVLEKPQNVSIGGFNLNVEDTFPESYNLFTRDGEPVAHLRLRSGSFTATVPDRFGKLVYHVRIESDGENKPSVFEAADRRRYLAEAVLAVEKVHKERP